MKANKLIPQLWILISLLFTIHIIAQVNIVGYEYAFDDGNPPTYVSIVPIQDFNLATSIDIGSLPNDVNVFYVRFKDNLGRWSTMVSKIFVKPPEASVNASTIVGYEYGFDDGNPPVYVAIPPMQDVNLTTDIDVSNLNNDVNVFYIRFQDDLGQWSSIASKIFVKPPELFTTASTIVGYEYGFNDIESTQYNSISSSQDFNLISNIDVSGLTNDVNVFFIRFKDDIGQWSSFISKIFVKPPESFASASTIVGYEYGFNDGSEPTYISITPLADYNLISDVDVSNLPNDVTIFYIRFKDDIGQWSSMLSKIFIKPPDTFASASSIVGYEYGFNDSNSPVYVPIAPTSDFNLVTDIDVNALSRDVNVLHMRFKDDIGQWSPIISKIFVHPPEPVSYENNTIVSYDYWFENDTEEKISLTLDTPVANYLLEEIDVSQLWAGEYRLNTQFKDAYGNYSVVMTDTINKSILPLAQFTADALEICSGETINFLNTSVDYDIQIWDFDDGTTSDLIDVSHTFNSPGIYQVSLWVEDSVSGFSDSTIQTIQVNEMPINTISVSTSLPACFGETVTLTADYIGGNYLWSNGETSRSISITQNGTFFVDISHSTSDLCSVTSESLEVMFEPEIDNSVTADETTITANQSGASYQWIDCTNGNTAITGETNQTFSPTIDGNYAVEINVNGCIVISECIPMSNLSVDDFNRSDAVKFYPNPVNQVLSIVAEFDISVDVFDVLGNRLKYLDIPAGTLHFDMANFESGLYLFRVYRKQDRSRNSRIVRIIKR